MPVKNIDVQIDSWLNGNELAYKFIFDHFYPRILAASLKLVKNQEDAEELVLNVLLKIWQNKHRVKELNKGLSGYLFGILRQEVSGLSRKKVFLTENLDDVPLQELGTIDHPEFNMRDLQLRYQGALNKLTPKQREIFLLSRDNQLSQQEIADSTGISVNTVSNHISASLKIIRKELQDYPDAIVVVLLTSQLTTLIS